ncbi:MAG TPA: RsmE family RNA methyltransferase [Candidatus Binatia bacterium]|nr:RsmE family RNA methyltransferase [Candidatus Binatia bacterium]
MSQGHTARFYTEELPVQNKVKLTPEQVRHSKALRLHEGDTIQLFDGTHEYQARFLGTHAEIVGKSEPNAPKGPKITLAVSWPKGERGDWLVEKVTELGVDTIIPLLTQRSVVDPRASKLERLKKVIINACEQSGRTILPTIEAPQMIRDVLAREFDAILIADKSGKPFTNFWLREHTEGGSTAAPLSTPAVLLLIGPEGGFTDDEIAAALAANANVISLGATTLRTETAGITLAALLRQLYAP